MEKKDFILRFRTNSNASSIDDALAQTFNYLSQTNAKHTQFVSASRDTVGCYVGGILMEFEVTIEHVTLQGAVDHLVQQLRKVEMPFFSVNHIGVEHGEITDLEDHSGCGDNW